MTASMQNACCHLSVHWLLFSRPAFSGKPLKSIHASISHFITPVQRIQLFSLLRLWQQRVRSDGIVYSLCMVL